MAEEECELNEKQKREIAKWFLLNSPAGEIQYIAKGRSVGHIYDFFFVIFVAFRIYYWSVLDLADLRSVLNDEKVYNEAASEAFPLYNKSHLICLELPNRSGDVSLFFFFLILVLFREMWVY